MALINVSNEKQTLIIDSAKHDIEANSLTDLVSGVKINESNGKFNIQLAPFQVMWLK